MTYRTLISLHPLAMLRWLLDAPVRADGARAEHADQPKQTVLIQEDASKPVRHPQPEDQNVTVTTCDVSLGAVSNLQFLIAFSAASASRGCPPRQVMRRTAPSGAIHTWDLTVPCRAILAAIAG